MKANWVEKLWINGPWRTLFIARNVRFFRGIHPLEKPFRVLDVGCGQGIGSQLLVRHFRAVRVDAIDIDPLMIRRATRRLKSIPSPNIHFSVGDAEALPFEDESMDAVFDFGILHHLEDWQRGIREIARVLKPGGAFYFEEYFPASYEGPILRSILEHPTENRFDGVDFLSEVARSGMTVLDDARETKYIVLAVALKHFRNEPGDQ